MALDPITTILDIGSRVLDKIFPDPAQRDAAKLELLKLQQTGELAQLAAETDLAKAQLAINQAEASSGDKFSARWRPFIGWVCGIAFAYVLVLQPFLIFCFAAAGHVIPTLPNIDSDLLGWALGGILGLGTMRSVEKVKGVTK